MTKEQHDQLHQRLGTIEARDVPVSSPRAGVQVTCPCENLFDWTVLEGDGFDRGRLMSECLDCGFTEIVKAIRLVDQPDSDH